MENGMTKRTHRTVLAGACLILAAVAAACGGPDRPATGAEVAAAAPTPESNAPDDRYLPQFTEEGELRRPEGWEAWVLAGTSMGLTYAENPREFAPGEAPGSFLQVYIQPWAYEAFMDTGEFPEGTMFILAGSEPVRKADPARGGFYQGDLHLMEVHLKQTGIHTSGWAFFGYGAEAESAARVPGEASCYTCHAENAEHDNVFVQFYPKIRERLGMALPAGGETGMPASPAEGAAPSSDAPPPRLEGE
jgi:hypothetical protein